MSRFKVLAVASDENIRFEIRKALSGNENIALVGFAAADETLLTKITGYAPHVVLLAKSRDTVGILEYARLIYQTYPGCALILLSDEVSLTSVNQAMDAGIRKVISTDNMASLSNVVTQAAILEQGRGGEVRKETRVISVYGTKGGSGKTNLAVNLAAAFALRKNRTAFIDLCLIYGDASVYLDLSTKDTIAELVQERSDFTIDDIKSFTLQHSSGINAICSPTRPDYADYVSPRHVEKLINLMRPYYDYIVIDLPADFSECTLAALENSDDILIVTRPDISGLRNTKIAVDVLNNLQQTEKIKIVINADKKGLLTHKDFERVLELPVSFSIPEDAKNAVLSMQRGVPIVMGMARNPMARAILGISDHFFRLRGGYSKMKLRDRLEIQRVVTSGKIEEDQNVSNPPKPVVIDAQQKLKERVRSQAIEMLHKEKNPDSLMVRAALDEVLQYEAEDVPRPERTRIAAELMNDIIGYGPLESLLQDPEVTEIMVNGPHKLYVEIKGKIHKVESPFRDNEHLNNIIDRIVSTIGRHVDESSPMVDARLKDGSRVNIIIPPLSLTGPVVTIRKFAKIPYTDKDIIEFGSVSPKMMSFLEACVKGRLSIVISGGTGSGKTTFLNVLSGYIPQNERIVTIEDAAEIQLKQEHVVTLESRPANIEGTGQITIRDLVRNALRMRPDRIVVGEVRSGEALDMLQAMNTGHDGSITTVHANSPRDALARIETMALMAGMDLPLNAIRTQIASAIDIVVHQSRISDGTRKVTSISEITGIEGDIITMQEIFSYESLGKVDGQGRFIGRFRPTGIIPYCLGKIRYHGVTAYDDWFVQ